MKTHFLISAVISVLLPQLAHSAFRCEQVFLEQVKSKSQIETLFSSVKAAREVFRVVPETSESIYIREKMGAVEEHSIRTNQIASHIYMDSGQQPYFFAAFPEGNSGVGLWFQASGGKALLQASSKARAIEGEGGLHGTEIEMKSGVNLLRLEDSVLGSMRFIRDRELGIAVPTEVKTTDIQVVDGSLILRRQSLNGLAEYRIHVTPVGDTKIVKTSSGYDFTAPSEVRFKVQALNSDKPLTPLSPSDVFKPEVLKAMSAEKLQAFSFLLYKEKLMAGSPRYLTKFGRDSIYTLRVLMSSMKPEAVENLLNATMSSMNPKSGSISHEQHEGDFASFVRLKEGKKVKGVNEAIEDYKMIDDDFAFTFVLGEYARQNPARVKSFLAGKDQRGIVRRELVGKLFDYVSTRTAAFRDSPVPANLVGLHEGETTGQWRDSDNGLAGGKYPFDVNAAFVPAALRALVELHSTPESGLYDVQKAADLRRSYQVWSTRVLPLFEVRISAAEATSRGEAYLRELNIDPGHWPAALKEDLVFPAISLDKDGKPIPVMHSDDSLMMTFGSPSLAYLRTVSQRIDNVFPYGLRTPVGVLVANPVFASQAIKSKFDETKYHGRVSWTMQEDLLVYGINRQLRRQDLPAALRKSLAHSKSEVEKVIQSKSAMGGTEVFSILYKDGQWAAIPFGGDAKSNSNQLWSHLNIASPQGK